MGSIPDWKEVSDKKRASAADKIPKEWRLDASYAQKYNITTPVSVLSVPRECGILSEIEIDITESYDVVTLAAKLGAGQFSSVAVTTAFCKRAAIAQQLTNCLTETFFDEALARAAYLDEYLAREKKVVGPLHGVPISVKTADSDNNVFGRTLNPHNLSLNAGGSSGGEGALVGMRGSLLGIGTDIGGSVRIPALCCGTYGFKPTSNRIPYGGQTSPGLPGSPGVLPAAGPLTTSFRDIQFFMEVLAAKEPWNYDSSAKYAPWRTVQPKRILTIGYFPGDPAFPVSPPVARALETAVKKLSFAGHKIVPFSPPSIKTSNEMILEYYGLDNTHYSMQCIQEGGEPLVPSVEIATKMYDVRVHTLESLWGLNAWKAKYSDEWVKTWVSNKFDVVLCPGAETTAVPHDTYGNCPYTMLWNESSIRAWSFRSCKPTRTLMSIALQNLYRFC